MSAKYETKKARLHDRLKLLEQDAQRIARKAHHTMAEIGECDRLIAEAAKAEAPAAVTVRTISVTT